MIQVQYGLLSSVKSKLGEETNRKKEMLKRRLAEALHNCSERRDFLPMEGLGHLTGGGLNRL